MGKNYEMSLIFETLNFLLNPDAWGEDYGLEYRKELRRKVLRAWKECPDE